MVPSVEFKQVGYTIIKKLNIINFIIQVKEAPFIHIARPTRKPQKILLCGWRRDIDDMIVVSSFYEAPNSFFSSPGRCRYAEEVYPETSLFQSPLKRSFFVVGDEIWKI